MAVDGARHGRRQPVAPGGRGQPFGIGRVGKEAQFHQHRGHIRGLQHHETRRAQGFAGHFGDGGDFGGQLLGKGHGVVFRFALGQIDEDAGDFRILIAKIEAGNDVGPVFLLGQRFGLGVGGGIGQGIEGGTAHRLAAHHVGMQ